MTLSTALPLHDPNPSYFDALCIAQKKETAMAIEDDPVMEHFLEVGKYFSRLQGWGSIVNKCNCMVRYGTSGGDQLPAVRKGRGKNAKFYTPEGDEIVQPTSYEDMPGVQIAKLMQ